MELKEFISETLIQIQEGVQDAINRRSDTLGSAGAINPVWGSDGDAISAEHRQTVEFDVAVTVTDKAGAAGKAGLKVFSIEFGTDLSKTAEQSTASRIKFSIPIVPPVQLVTPRKQAGNGN